MSRHQTFGGFLFLASAVALGLTPSTRAQTSPSPQTTRPSAQASSQSKAATRAESLAPALAILEALRANPVTAPYPITVALRGGKVILAGRVGTKQVHDAAVRSAIASGYPFRDDLVIDTAEAHRAAALTTALAGASTGVARPAVAAPSLGSMPYTLGNLPYVYPPPLFGRLDDPFFGFEPPILSYPPWWGAVAARDTVVAPATVNTAPAAVNTAPAPAAQPNTTANPSAAPTQPQTTIVPDGAIEMTLNPRGVAVLRGTVPTLADRVAVGQMLAQTPGIAEVVNLLTVGKMVTATDTPPPPPQPAAPRQARPPAGPQPGPIQDEDKEARRNGLAVDAEDLNDRLVQAIARRPALANLPLKVRLRDGVATLSGKVPTVYEAMLAFRAVQQTPGVREVTDRLEFVVPDGEKTNPLRAKGRPEDVEPYLTAQIRRHVGDLAHIDQVRLRGDTLEVRGTLVRADDRARLEAILRSLPVLRGYRVEPTFVVD